MSHILLDGNHQPEKIAMIISWDNIFTEYFSRDFPFMRIVNSNCLVPTYEKVHILLEKNKNSLYTSNIYNPKYTIYFLSPQVVLAKITAHVGNYSTFYDYHVNENIDYIEEINNILNLFADKETSFNILSYLYQ